MKSTALKNLLLIIFILIGHISFSQDLIINGDMEAGPGGPSALPTDWTIVQHTPDNCASPPSPCPGPTYVINVSSPDGDRWVRFFRGGGWNERFGQYLCTPLVFGETYTLEFWASYSDLNSSATASTTGIDFGFSIGLPVGTGAGAGNPGDIDLTVPESWVLVTHTFVASGNYDFISFAKNTTDVSNATYIDGASMMTEIGTILPNDTLICEGESLLLDVGEFSAPYLWQDGSDGETFLVTESGEYYVDIGTGACIISDTIIVTFVSEPIVSLGADTTLCEGESLVLDVSGEVGPYLWQDGSTDPTYNVTISGEYYVDIGSGACSGNDTILVTFVSGPIVNLGADTTLCEGESLVLDVSGISGPYLWQDGTTDPTYNITLTGEYYVEIGTGSCIGYDTILVTFVTAPIVNLGADTTLCEGDNLLLDISGLPGPYLWQDGSAGPTFNVTLTGEYFIEIGSGTCISKDTILVTFIAPPTISLGADTSLCEGENLILDVSGFPAPYLWQDGSTGSTFNVTSIGTYWVELENLCATRDSIDINYTTIDLNMGLDDSVNCGPFTVNFNADALTNGPEIVDWNWDFGDGGVGNTQNPSHLYNSPGLYSVTLTVTTDNGCVKSITSPDWISVYEIPQALFSCNPMELTTDNTEVNFTDLSINANTYDWSFGYAFDGSFDQNPSYTYPSSIGNYDVKLLVTSTDGCIDSTTKTIIINESLLFFIPNTFTPDGDLYNETFSPKFTSGIDPYDFHMAIFNRWGELVFETYNKEIGWSGTYGNSGLVEDGTYIWQVDFKVTSSDKRYKSIGHVTLLK